MDALQGMTALVQELLSTMWPLLILPHTAGAALHRVRYFSGCNLLLLSLLLTFVSYSQSYTPTKTEVKLKKEVLQSDN